MASMFRASELQEGVTSGALLLEDAQIELVKARQELAALTNKAVAMRERNRTGKAQQVEAQADALEAEIRAAELILAEVAAQ